MKYRGAMGRLVAAQHALLLDLELLQVRPRRA
jgi:hypothetical protein